MDRVHGADAGAPTRWPGRIVCLLSLLLVSLAGTLAADEAPSDARAFEKSLEKLHDCCRRQRYDFALRRLEALLEKHEGRPYVRARRAELEDLAERLAFGKRHPPPSADAVVTGKVEKYDPDTGYLKIRYRPEDAGDLIRQAGGILVFPAPVRGEFLLEVWGKAYPIDTGDAPRVVVSGDENPRTERPEGWHIVFGTPAREIGERQVWLPAQILHWDGKNQRLLASLDAVPIKTGNRFKLQVKFAKSWIHAGVNSKPLLNAKKPPGFHGFVGFDAPTWNRMKFTGTIEPAWLQDRLDRAMQAQLREFRKTWDPSTVLPAWLFEIVNPEAKGPAVPRREIPVALDRKARGRFVKFKGRLRRGDFEGAEEAVRELQSAGAPAPTCAYLEAWLDLERGRLGRGLEAVDRCLQEEPSFLEGQLLRGRILRRLGRSDEALKAFLDAIARHEREPHAYETAAFSMLQGGRPDAAKRVAELATEHGVESTDLSLLGEAIVKAFRGPTWNRIHEYRSRHYHVVSDIDKDTCVEAAKLLEEALTAWRVNLHWVAREKDRRYRVYVFSGREGFLAYFADLEGLGGSPPGLVAGAYSPILKQLLIWNLPERDEMLETIRHEGFHQYLDRWMSAPPIWFNEGLAVYHQNPRRQRGSLVFGRVHRHHLKTLRAQRRIPLEQFLRLTPEQFYAMPAVSYAQAWALMHLMMKGDRRSRDLFKALVKDLQDLPANEVFEKHLTPGAVKRLERDLARHIDDMR